MEKIKKIFFPILISIMLLTPILNLPLTTFFKSLDIYVNIFFIFFILYTFFIQKKINKYFLKIIFALLILIIYLIILELIFQLKDYSAISFLFRSIITIISSYSCAYILSNLYKNSSISYFGKIIFICSIIQGFVIWVSLLSNPFRDFMSFFFYRDFSNENQHLIMLRVPGFVDSGGDGLSMNHGLLCVVGFISMLTMKKAKSAFRVLPFVAIFSAIACLFTGRTGLYMSLFLIILSISLYKNGKFSIFNLSRFILIIFIVFSVFVFFANALGDYGTELKNEYGFEHPVVRFLKGFMNFSSGEIDSYQDDTIIALTTDHVVFPNTFLRFIFGNNSFGTANDPIPSDVGYIKYLHGMGFIGLFYILSFFILCYLFIKKFLNKITINFYLNNNINYLIIIVLLYGFIGHYKIYYLTSRVFLFIFFTYLFMIYNMSKSEKNTNTQNYLLN